MKILSAKVCAEIDRALRKYPDDQRQSAVIAALMTVQRANHGWLSTTLMDAVADYLGMPKIAVYEVASFYSLFELAPVGKHKISVCTNISCMLRGSEQIVEHLCQKIGIEPGQTSTDGKFTLKTVECLAACGGAPMLQLDDDYHENLTIAAVDKLLARLE